MRLVTVINDELHSGFNLLRLSCVLNDVQLTVLVSNKSHFDSRRIKDELLADYLDTLNDDEIVLFTDGNDAIITASQEEITEKFLGFNSDVVFSAESCCWPDTRLANNYPQVNGTPYRFLNSGGFIGKVGAIKFLLADTELDFKSFKNSNQYLWTQRFIKNTEIIKLDTGCTIFCTFSPEIGEHYLQMEPPDYITYCKFRSQWFQDTFCIQKGRIFNRITKSWPCQAHFNGSAKHLINNDIIDMVYSNINNFKRPIFYYEKD